MDDFVVKFMEKVFEKTEKYPINEETKSMLDSIRKIVNDSPRHSKKSSNVEEYFKNTKERIISELNKDIENETSNSNVLLESYIKVNENKDKIKMICNEQ